MRRPGDARYSELALKQTMTEPNESIRDEVQRLDGFEVLDCIAARVLDHFGFRPLCDYRKAEVADPVIRAISLMRFVNEVESGCIHQYLFNSRFDEAVYVKESLDVIDSQSCSGTPFR